MLDGKKVKLVPLEKKDLPKSLTWVNDSELNSRMLRVLPVTQLDQEQWYQDIVSDSAKIVFAIKTQDGAKHIGNTGLYCIDWIHRRAEFWILIGERDYWKRGIGEEIVSLIQQFSFNKMI